MLHTCVLLALLVAARRSREGESLVTVLENIFTPVPPTRTEQLLLCWGALQLEWSVMSAASDGVVKWFHEGSSSVVQLSEVEGWWEEAVHETQESLQVGRGQACCNVQSSI